MLDKMQKDLTLRLELVNGRLSAIRLEEESLSAEQQNLVDLINLYKKRPYDPIDAERKHTENLLGSVAPEARVAPERRDARKGHSIYEDAFAVIYEMNNHTPLSCRELADAVSDLVSQQVSVPSLYNTVHKMIEAGKMTESQLPNGRRGYTWCKHDVQVQDET